jgi:exopolysaccharide biosynthesis polyprenyl glycosylphosphotransferase
VLAGSPGPVLVSAFAVSCVLLLAVDGDALGARLVAVWLLALVLSFAARWLFDGLLTHHYGDADYPRALLVGTHDECVAALGALSGAPPWQRVAVVGLVGTGEGTSTPAAPGEPRVVASPETLEPALRRYGVSEVILADPLSLNGGLRQVMDACRAQRVALKVVLGDLQLDGHSVGSVPGLGCPFFVILSRRSGRRSYIVKRVFDLVTALALLVVLSPVLLLIAALIKLTSRGPVFFVSERIGIDQRPFRFYKFRSMVVDAEAAQEDLEACNECDGVIFKMRADPRVTKVGRVLRRLSLDELPQLINVLKGDMSIVGPRPLPLRDCGQMDEWHRRRHVVKPGITGLWQVSGRSELGFDQMIDLDVRYIDTWTLWMDVVILGRTASAVVSSRGAY